jgi:transcription elongation factor SPT5
MARLRATIPEEKLARMTHQQIDQAREAMEAQQLAAQLEQRHEQREGPGKDLMMEEDVEDEEDADSADEGLGGERRAGSRGRFELPKPTDPRLWAVACKVGEEAEAAVQLMRRFFICRENNTPLQIISVVANPPPRTIGGRSYIYVEAYREHHVKEAIKGLEALAMGQYKQTMVSPNDTASALRVVKQRHPGLERNSFVRFRTGAYKGDLARVVEVNLARNLVSVDVVPRIDYAGLAARQNSAAAGGSETKEKRKRSTTRPQAQLFDIDRITAVGGNPTKRDEEIHYDGKIYRHGLLRLERVRLQTISTDPAVPTVDELRLFQSDADTVGASGAVAASLGENTGPGILRKGDVVQITAPGMHNLMGIVISIAGDDVTVHAEADDLPVGLLSVLFRFPRPFVD